MRKVRAKFTAILMVLCCTFALLGLLTGYSAKEQTAKAESTLTITSATAYGVAEIGLEAQTEGFIEGIGNWDDGRFLYVSGHGVFYNDIAMTADSYAIKKIGEYENTGLYWFLEHRKSAVSGDEFVFDGTFVCEADASITVTFEKLGFRYNGTSWDNFVADDRYEVKEITPTGTNTSSALNASVTSGEALGVNNSSYEFAFKAGTGKGFLLNNVAHTGWTMKQPSNGVISINLGIEAKKGDSITLDGVFYNESAKAKIVFYNCALVFDGTAWATWKVYTAYSLVTYDPLADGSAFYAYSTDFTKPSHEGDPNAWNYMFSFEEGSGNVFMYNEENITTWKVKQPGDFYVETGKSATSGDEIVIDGAFINAEWGIRFVFENCGLRYNGSAWEAFDANVTYKVGKLQISSKEATANHVYLRKSNDGTLDGANGWDDNTFVLKRGKITLNGEVITPTIKDPGSLFIDLGSSANGGDVFTICGTIYNAEKIQYVIEESSFFWTGSEWKDCVDLGSVTSITSSANAVYMDVEKTQLPISSWDYAPTLTLGHGLTIDGEEASIVNNVKSVGNELYVSLSGVREKSILTIGGVFYYAEIETYYVLKETTFMWENGAWSKIGKPYSIGSIKVSPNSNNGAASTAANQLYVNRADGGDFPFQGWENPFVLESGEGLTVNGKKVSFSEIQSAEGMWFLFAGVEAGDVITIGGTFYCANQDLRYFVKKSAFTWNGKIWIDYYTDESLAYYDEVSIYDLGLGLSKEIVGTYDGSGLDYENSKANTTGSIKFSFDFNSAVVKAGEVAIRLRGGAWEGYLFKVSTSTGAIRWIDETNNSPQTSVSLEDGVNYHIEIGVIDVLGTNKVWIYVAIDGKIYLASETVKDAQFNTSHVSLYFSGAEKIVLGDTEHVAVTYVYDGGSFEEIAPKVGEYTLASAMGNKEFIGWTNDGNMYSAGYVVENLGENITFTALAVEFTMIDGASIRLNDSADFSGIRFTSRINKEDFDALVGYGIQSVKYGTLILPNDYLGGKAPSAPELGYFVPGETILKIESTCYDLIDGYIVFRGAMQKIRSYNYDRDFASRGYMEITYANGTTQIIYTKFTSEHVRSIKYVAQEFKKDTEKYNKLNDNKKAVVDAYIGETPSVQGETPETGKPLVVNQPSLNQIERFPIAFSKTQTLKSKVFSVLNCEKYSFKKSV